MRPEQEIGNKYGMLTVIGVDSEKRTSGGHKYILCLCDCGEETKTLVYNLRSGHTKSCGCAKKEGNATHGMSKTRFYSIWENMKTRVTNVNSTSYENYGGRGITLYSRWNDFQAFYDDMYESYVLHCRWFGESNTTIDRIDPDGDYEPGNVRWATMKIQAVNKRNNPLPIPDEISFDEVSNEWILTINGKNQGNHSDYNVIDEWRIQDKIMRDIYEKEGKNE